MQMNTADRWFAQDAMSPNTVFWDIKWTVMAMAVVFGVTVVAIGGTVFMWMQMIGADFDQFVAMITTNPPSEWVKVWAEIVEGSVGIAVPTN